MTMSDVSTVRVSGPLQPYAMGFGSELLRRGYAPFTAMLQVQLVAHLSRWLVAEGRDVDEVTPDLLERFAAARRAAGYRHQRSVRALAPLLGYLREIGVAPPEAAFVPCTPVEKLVERYRHHLADERGLHPETVSNRVREAQRFLAAQIESGELDLAGLTSARISAYVVDETRRRSRGDAKLMVCALRSLLRFLQLEGLVDESLVGAVPAIAHWRSSGLPRALAPGQFEQLLDSCDRSTIVGRRDYAVLLVLGRLGLRAGEVVGLQLDDIDWRAGEITVRGKGKRRDRLPLPAEVGEAIAAYLKDGRPASAEGRSVFVTVRGHRRGIRRKAVGRIAARAALTAGIAGVSAHRLRHTVATEVLRAGAPLEEVGQLLRHHSAVSTAIYAKVDHQRLRGLARTWPKVRGQLDGERLRSIARCWPGGAR
jgi:site-specific recombinase XerD